MKRLTTQRSLFIRYTMYMIGIVIMAAGLAMMIKVDIGVSPWDVFHIGLQKTFGLTIGTWSQITGALVIGLSYLIARVKPGLPTLLNIIFLGLFIDLFVWLDLFPGGSSLLEKLCLLLLGIVVYTVGAGLYISPRLGAGPRDSLMLALHEKKGWSIQKVRIGIEVSVLFAGWFMDGPVSYGTLLVAILTGPLLQRTILYWERLLGKSYGLIVEKQLHA